MNDRHEITTVNHYDVFPFDNGGKLYIRDYYKALSEWFNINIISFVTSDIYEDITPINKYIRVFSIQVPEELKTRRDLYDLYEEWIAKEFHKNDKVIEAVRNIGANSSIVFAEHCYTYRIISNAFPDKTIGYRAHNVEFDFVKSRYNIPEEKAFDVYDIERECVTNSKIILTISNHDIDRFCELYDVRDDRFVCLGVGYNVDKTGAILPSQRKPVGNDYENYGFFISSYSENAIAAANNAIRAAKELQNTNIIIAGGVCDGLKNDSLPENVALLGYITDERKDWLLAHCDFALNLMDFGAGINIKMLEYFACGIPVITTAHGVRGIGVQNGKDCLIVKENYSGAIKQFCSLNTDKKDDIARNAINLVEKQHNWRVLAEKTIKKFENKLDIVVGSETIRTKGLQLYSMTDGKEVLVDGYYYIRCAGERGKECVNNLRERGCVPNAFIDQNITAKSIEGVSVIRWDELPQMGRDATIIIATDNFCNFYEEALNAGFQSERILLYLRGGYYIRLYDGEGSIPRYYSRERILDKR